MLDRFERLGRRVAPVLVVATLGLTACGDSGCSSKANTSENISHAPSDIGLSNGQDFVLGPDAPNFSHNDNPVNRGNRITVHN